MHSQRADDAVRVDLVLITAKDPRHAEIRNLGIHVMVQEDVAGLEITVHDAKPRVPVKVKKTSSDPFDNVEPRLPVQEPSPRRI